MCDKSDFDHSFNVAIIDLCSPKNIEKKEHKYIHLLFNTIKPDGYEFSKPFRNPTAKSLMFLLFWVDLPVGFFLS